MTGINLGYSTGPTRDHLRPQPPIDTSTEEYDPTDPKLYTAPPPSTSRLDQICSALACAQHVLTRADPELVPKAQMQVLDACMPTNNGDSPNHVASYPLVIPNECTQAFKKARTVYTTAAKANQHRDPRTVKYCTTHHLNMTNAVIPVINALIVSLNCTLSQLEILNKRVDTLEIGLVESAKMATQSTRSAKRQRMD